MDEPHLNNLIAIAIPYALFAMVVTIVIGALYFKNQRDKMWHETARLAIEKGQPIPDKSFTPFNRFAGNEGAYLRWQVRRDAKIGLILLAIGIAICVHFSLNQGWGIGSAGIIPGAIGLAFLSSAWLNSRAAAKTPNSDAPPPRQ